MTEAFKIATPYMFKILMVTTIIVILIFATTKPRIDREIGA